jgi:2-methylisocitrate lyase-like PEP mutase family enzyme
MPALADKAAALLALHTAPEILVLANVWDVVSAQVVASTDGAKALATASHSIASTFGYEDGENIPLELHLDMVARIVRAVDLPVTMDFEAGYGDAGETARRAIEVGVVGANLEDQMKPLAESVAAVEAVVRAGRDAGIDFVLNARPTRSSAQAKDDDRGELVEEAVARGRAYLEAGAPVVFVPGAVARDEIAALVDGLGPQHADRHQRARRLAPGSRAAGARRRPCLDRAVHPARRPDRAAGRRPGDLAGGALPRAPAR